jgi:hypothetical protein
MLLVSLFSSILSSFLSPSLTPSVASGVSLLRRPFSRSLQLANDQAVMESTQSPTTDPSSTAVLKDS